MVNGSAGEKGEKGVSTQMCSPMSSQLSTDCGYLEQSWIDRLDRMHWPVTGSFIYCMPISFISYSFLFTSEGCHVSV